MARRAVTKYRQAIGEKQAPTLGDRAALADALWLSGEFQEAMKITETLTREAPDNLAYAGQLGVLAASLGQVDRARRIADDLQRVSRKFLRGAHLYARARVLAALGDSDGSMSAFNAAFARLIPSGIRRRSRTRRGQRTEPLRPVPTSRASSTRVVPSPAHRTRRRRCR